MILTRNEEQGLPFKSAVGCSLLSLLHTSPRTYFTSWGWFYSSKFKMMKPCQALA